MSNKVFHDDGTEAWPDDDRCICEPSEVLRDHYDIQVIFTPAPGCPVHPPLAR